MKILQINASDNSNGGASRIACDLHYNLRKGHIETEMFTGVKSSDDPSIHKVPITLLSRIACKLFANDIDFFTTDYILNSSAFKTSDIVHCHNIHGGYFNLSTLKKMGREKPVIWTLHDMWAITSHCAHTKLNSKRNGLYKCHTGSPCPHLWNNSLYLSYRKKQIYNKAKFHIVTPSNWLAEKVKGTVLEDKPVKVIYNGIDVDIFKPLEKTEIRNKLKLPLNTKIIIFVASGGLKNPYKGGNFLLELAKKYEGENKITFLCVGGEIDEVNKNIIYRKGTSNKENIAEYFSASDILLFPSIAESLGLVLLEAGACGIPSVTFNVGGIPEIITHKKNGYISNKQNSNGLKEGIDWIINLPENEISNLKKVCRENVVLNFSLERMIAEYVKYYKELLNTIKK